jgi:hypothetical protein
MEPLALSGFAAGRGETGSSAANDIVYEMHPTLAAPGWIDPQMTPMAQMR